MILEREEVSWTCGMNHNVTKHGFRYRVQCDNPDCGKIFYRQDKQVKSDAKRDVLTNIVLLIARQRTLLVFVSIRAVMKIHASKHGARIRE